MAKISALPAASALDGTEQSPAVQTGATVRTTLQAIANLFKGTRGTSIASAATVNLGAATGTNLHITGNTGPITSLGTASAGVERDVIFDSTPTITHNATSLILPTGANIVAAAGDSARFISEGSGNWTCVRYQRKSGAALTGGTGDVVGPSSSVADRIALFDGATGKLLKDGAKTIADLRTPAVQSVTSSATVTPTFLNDMVEVTAQAAALAWANPTGTAIPGLGIVLRVKDNGTARAMTYGTQYRAIGITLPTTTVIGKTTYIAMIYNSADTKWDCIATGTEA